MKTRNGFVSNSSSSSFLIYGAELSNHREELSTKFSEDREIDRWELRDLIEKETGLEVSNGPEGDYLYVGKSWDSIKDDETGLQFKQSVEKIFKEKLGLDVKLETCSEAWYNG